VLDLIVPNITRPYTAVKLPSDVQYYLNTVIIMFVL